MEQTEAMETSVEMTESLPEAQATAEREAPGGVLPAELLSEAEVLRGIYPHFDLAAEMEHPVMGALLRGEGKPTLRQLYEAVHMEDILEGRVASAVEEQISRAVESAVAEAVSAAVSDCEERLLGHIRARGQRPAENGLSAAAGIRMYPAVDRLTRRERAMLAKRAENGETVQL